MDPVEVGDYFSVQHLPSSAQVKSWNLKHRSLPSSFSRSTLLSHANSIDTEYNKNGGNGTARYTSPCVPAYGVTLSGFCHLHKNQRGKCRALTRNGKRCFGTIRDDGRGFFCESHEDWAALDETPCAGTKVNGEPCYRRVTYADYQYCSTKQGQALQRWKYQCLDQGETPVYEDLGQVTQKMYVAMDLHVADID